MNPRHSPVPIVRENLKGRSPCWSTCPQNTTMKSALFVHSALNLLPLDTLKMFTKGHTTVSVVSFVTNVVRALQLCKDWVITRANTQGTISLDAGLVTKDSTTSN